MGIQGQIEFDLGLAPSTQEDINKVIEELSHPCYACGLGSLNKDNPGLITRGNPLGWISFVSQMPADNEWRLHKAMVGPAGRELDDWCNYHMHIDIEKEAFIINVVQCLTPKVKAKNEKFAKHRAPDRDELRRCFPTRCLRVLKAMPNLKCVVTLGGIATQLILGEKPLEKVHTGNWFTCKLLPGVAVFVLPHPVILCKPDVSEETEANIERLLKKFANTLPGALNIANKTK